MAPLPEGSSMWHQTYMHRASYGGGAKKNEAYGLYWCL